MKNAKFTIIALIIVVVISLVVWVVENGSAGTDQTTDQQPTTEFRP